MMCATRNASTTMATSNAYGRFPKFNRVFVGPRPWHIEIRHRVKKTSTMNLLGFETLKLKNRRLKLWKPTVTTMANTITITSTIAITITITITITTTINYGN